MEHYEYYTDGASTLKESKGEYVRITGGWSYVKLKGNKICYISYGGELKATNNSMELYAIYAALRDCESNCEPDSSIEICTDSAYCFNIYTQWAKSWERNGWTRGKKHEQIKNVEIIKATWTILNKISNSFNIQFKKVKGHSNDKLNELADNYAVKGKELSMQGKSMLYPGYNEIPQEV